MVLCVFVDIQVPFVLYLCDCSVSPGGCFASFCDGCAHLLLFCDCDCSVSVFCGCFVTCGQLCVVAVCSGCVYPVWGIWSEK